MMWGTKVPFEFGANYSNMGFTHVANAPGRSLVIMTRVVVFAIHWENT